MTAAAFSSKWKQQHSAAGASSNIQQQVAAATGGGSIHSSRSNMHSSRWGQRWGHVPARTFYTVAGPSFWPKYPLICSQTSQVQDRPWEQALHCRDPTSNKAGSGVKEGLRLLYSCRNAVVEQTHLPLQIPSGARESSSRYRHVGGHCCSPMFLPKQGQGRHLAET